MADLLALRLLKFLVNRLSKISPLRDDVDEKDESSSSFNSEFVVVKVRIAADERSESETMKATTTNFFLTPITPENESFQLLFHRQKVVYSVTSLALKKRNIPLRTCNPNEEDELDARNSFNYSVKVENGNSVFKSAANREIKLLKEEKYLKQKPTSKEVPITMSKLASCTSFK
uniref:Uncharacterized protein n=1 Tax=Romanomermis culicivorax TaxID=13658 RepID=A0A915HHL3_ROMCU